MNHKQYPVLNQFLQAVKKQRPFLDYVLTLQGERSLAECAASFTHSTLHTIDDPIDAAQAASEEAERLLGQDIAQQLFAYLTRHRLLFTGHHHGVDFTPMAIQASIFSTLGKKRSSIVPILSCSNIPLDNPDKAIGIVIDPAMRINLFSNKYAHQLVGVAPPVTETMVANAVHSAAQKVSQINLRQAVLSLLEQEYRSPNVLAQSSFADQAPILNGLVWRRLFPHQEIGTPVSLVLEKIVKKLLEKDLCNPQSLLYSILFYAPLRKMLVDALQDIPGCWNNGVLQQAYEGNGDMQAGKSVFFWGIDEEGRATRFMLVEEAGGPSLLRVAKNLAPFKIPLTPEAILENLQKGSLMPGLFLSFAALAFARGFACYGGFMQTDYLSRMKNSLMRCLLEIGRQDWEKCLSVIPTANYAYGPIFVMARTDQGTLRPAGTIDMLAAGGLSTDQLNKIQGISLNEATFSGIIDIYRAICWSNTAQEVALMEQAKTELTEVSASMVIL